MAERIEINIVPREVGIRYFPDSPEAVFKNEMMARELALNALAVQAIRFRQQAGLPVPAALSAVAEACTYLELM